MAKMSCLTNAWDQHERELRGWLRGRLGNPHDAEDVLQDLFLKAMRQNRKFCEIANARAWLFEVARNAVADRLRLKKEQVELPDDLAAEQEETPAIESLAACLPRALSELSKEDRDAITRCDLDCGDDAISPKTSTEKLCCIRQTGTHCASCRSSCNWVNDQNVSRIVRWAVNLTIWTQYPPGLFNSVFIITTSPL